MWRLWTGDAWRKGKLQAKRVSYVDKELSLICRVCFEGLGEKYKAGNLVTQAGRSE